MTRLCSTSRIANPSGYLVSLFGVDGLQIVLFAYQFAIPVGAVICLPVLLGVIALKAGATPALSCTGYLLFLMSLPFLASRCHKILLVSRWTVSSSWVVDKQKTTGASATIFFSPKKSSQSFIYGNSVSYLWAPLLDMIISFNGSSREKPLFIVRWCQKIPPGSAS